MDEKIKKYENEAQGSCVYCAQRISLFMDVESKRFNTQCWKKRILSQAKDVDQNQGLRPWYLFNWDTWIVLAFRSHTFVGVRKNIDGYSYNKSPGAVVFDGWKPIIGNIQARCGFKRISADEMYEEWPYPASNWENDDL